MRPGDIHWIELPPAVGREQEGRRPAVILQDEDFCRGNPLVTVLPITSATAALRFAGTLPIEPSDSNKLRQRSVILVFQIRAIDRTKIREKVGEVTPEQLSEVYLLMDKLTGRHS